MRQTRQAPRATERGGGRPRPWLCQQGSLFRMLGPAPSCPHWPRSRPPPRAGRRGVLLFPPAVGWAALEDIPGGTRCPLRPAPNHPADAPLSRGRTLCSSPRSYQENYNSSDGEGARGVDRLDFTVTLSPAGRAQPPASGGRAWAAPALAPWAPRLPV